MTHNIPEKFDKSDPLNIKIVGIEADKKQSIEVPYKNRTLSSKTLTKLSLFLKLQEKIEQFLYGYDNIILQKNLFFCLKTLKLEFDTLSKKNVSKETQFSEELSKNWQAILDFVNHHKDHLHQEFYMHQLKIFIETVHGYPENSDHTLGYYLTKLIGKDWLPFPFMEILETLHEDAILNKDKSRLAIWIKQIEEIIYTSA
jgi:hypothetical protein